MNEKNYELNDEELDQVVGGYGVGDRFPSIHASSQQNLQWLH